MVAIVPAIAAELANGARDALRQGAAVLTGNQSNYIKDGEPESIYGKIQQATARQACRRYADDPSIYSGGRKVIAENICRPYLNDINYGSPGSIKLPFSGGQCAGVNYRANGKGIYTIINCNTGEAFPNQEAIIITEYQFPGPIVSVTGRTFGASACGPNQFTFDIVFAGGTQQSNFGFVINPVNAVNNPRFEGVFEPADGVATECGSPPPDIIDPTPPPTPGPRFEPFNPSPDINVNIGVEVNIDGSFDVDFGTGPITIDPFSDSPAGGGGDSQPPGDIGEPAAPENTGAGGDADGEAPPGKVLTALKISFASPPVGGNEYKPGIFRGVCYIYMGTSDGVDHDPAGAMLRNNQLVLAEKDNLTHWAVSANLGYDLNVTPYYRDAES